MEISRAWYVGHMIGLPISRWFRESLLPVISVAVLAGAAALVVRMALPSTIIRVMAVTATYGLVSLPLIWWLAMGSWEREHFQRVAGEIMLRVARSKAREPVTVDAAGANPPADEHAKMPENKPN